MEVNAYVCNFLNNLLSAKGYAWWSREYAGWTPFFSNWPNASEFEGSLRRNLQMNILAELEKKEKKEAACYLYLSGYSWCEDSIAWSFSLFSFTSSSCVLVSRI